MTVDIHGGTILRMVTIELPEGTRDDAVAIVAEAKRVFLDIEGVTSIDAFVRAGEDDVPPGCVLLVGLRDLDAVATYVPDPVHRAFADGFVKPRGGIISIANHDLTP